MNDHLNSASSLFQTTENQALLVIKDAARKDSGPYKLILKNESGTVEGTVNVTVLGTWSSVLVFTVALFINLIQNSMILP